MSDFGSITEMSIDGVSYNVRGDAATEFNPSRVVKETMAHSGGTSTKHTLRVPEIRNIVLDVTLAEVDQVKDKCDQRDPVKISVTFYDGSQAKSAKCNLTCEAYNNQDGSMAVHALSKLKEGWTIVAA